MRLLAALIAGLSAIARPALAASVAVGISVSFPPGPPAPAGNLALTRTVNNPLGSTSSASAFKMIGEPFKAYPTATPEVPPGNALTAAWQNAGVPARIGVCERKYDASGNLSWAQVMVDASTAAIPSASSDTLVFSSGAGAFGNTTVGVSAESAGTFTLASSTLEAGFAQRPIEFTGSLGGLAGFSLNQLYYAYYVSATTFTLWTEAGVQITPTGTYSSGLSINLDTSARTDADWIALNDTIVASNVSTYSTGGADMNSGPYTATFNGGATNQITVLCTSPVGREVQVSATLINSGSVAHCYLKALMDYWVPQTSAGAAGPIESIPVVENMQFFKSPSDGCSGQPGEFTADLAWKRNGTLMRQFLQVPIPMGNPAPIVRNDGDWDYASNDPGFVVTQDYTLVDATYKTPPYIHGIVYTGGPGSPSDNTFPTIAISAVNTTTGLFTMPFGGNFIVINPATAYGGGVVGGVPTIPTAFQFTDTGSSGLTGISVCNPNAGPCSSTVYWTCPQTSSPPNETFLVYDTEFHAYNCVAGAGNGQIIPGGSYGGSGLNVGMAVAPESNGAFRAWGAEGVGGRPDLNLFTEWGTAFLLASNTYTAGQTYLWQTMGREQAWALGTMPILAVDKTTNRMISVLDAAHTPAALGTAKTNSWWACSHGWSTDINAGHGPTGGTVAHPDAPCGLWQISDADHAAGNPGYIVWVLEGNPYLQRLGVLYGNEGAWTQQILGERNAHNATIGSGATYYAVANNPNESQSIRGNAWMLRDEGASGREMAIDGSAEEQVFSTELTNWANYMNAYYAYKLAGSGNSNFQNLGLFSPDDQGSGVLANMNQPYNSNFMSAFGTMTMGMLEGLFGDLLPAFDTVAQNIGMFQAKMFTDTANFCVFMADTYNVGVELSPTGSARPGQVVSTTNDIGAGASEVMFGFAGTTVSLYNTDGVPQPEYTDNTPLLVATLTAGDVYRPYAEISEIGDSAVTPPTVLTLGQEYPVMNPVASPPSMQLNNGSGSPISFPAGPGVQQSITNATWAANVVAITTALPIGFNINQSLKKTVIAGLSIPALNTVASATLNTSATAATWAANQVTFTTSSGNVPIQPGDTFTTQSFSPAGYNGTFTAAAGTGGNTVIAALLTNPGTVVTKGLVNYPTNEFTYAVTGSGSPTFSGATETPLDGGTLVPKTYKGANCPATGMVHSGSSPNAGTYLDQIRAGLCLQSSAQGGAAPWSAACNAAIARLTGGGFNLQAAWAMGNGP